MSSYVDALKRWRLEGEDQAMVPAEANGAAPDPGALYDRLRERLQIAAGNQPLRVLAFAGVNGGEGVAHVAMGYAQRLAQTSLNVLVVLADAHVVRAALDVPVLDLVKLVEAGASPPPGERRSVQVVGLPSRYASAGQFLVGSAFTSWLVAQAPLYDQIVMEVPPVLKYAEASVLGKHADGVVLVVRATVTQVGDVGRAQRQLTRAGARLLGAVLNQVQAPPSFLRRLLMPELVQGSGGRSGPAPK